MRLTLFLTMILAAAPAVAQSDDCLSEADARSVVAYALPVAVETTVARCRSLLPAGAWLTRNGGDLAARYRRDGGGRPDAALPVLERLSGQSLPDFLDPATVSTMVEGLITDRVRAAVVTRNCPAMSRIAEQISPLPIGNVVSLLVALVQLDDRATSSTGIRICSAPQAGAR